MINCNRTSDFLEFVGILLMFLGDLCTFNAIFLVFVGIVLFCLPTKFVGESNKRVVIHNLILVVFHSRHLDGPFFTFHLIFVLLGVSIILGTVLICLLEKTAVDSNRTFKAVLYALILSESAFLVLTVIQLIFLRGDLGTSIAIYVLLGVSIALANVLFTLRREIVVESNRTFKYVLYTLILSASAFTVVVVLHLLFLDGPFTFILIFVLLGVSIIQGIVLFCLRKKIVVESNRTFKGVLYAFILSASALTAVLVIHLIFLDDPYTFTLIFYLLAVSIILGIVLFCLGKKIVVESNRIFKGALYALILLASAFHVAVFIHLIHPDDPYTFTSIFFLLGVSIILGIVLFCLRKKNVADVENGILGEGDDLLDQVSGFRRKFSYNDLDSATGNFDENKKLGGGGFGSVFEGTLDDGTKIAVKRLDPLLGQGRKEFLAEVMTMGSIHHVNLVKLLGFCAENCHRLLAYEYMCNGSLDKWIFHRNQVLTLNWQTRKKIVLDIAKGLSYLHGECQPRIIHLDIKPQNILLDAEFNAKLSDFGLARFIDRDQSQVLTTLRGTRGYLAPEWVMNRRISEKVDVYSFGVVVLELMCGRKNLENSDNEFLLDLVKRKAEEEQLFDVVDKQSEDMLHHRNEAVEMIRTAISCVQGDCTRRPSMSVVVKVLEGLMVMENMFDYRFITMNPMEISREVLASGSAPMLPISLSGPR